MKIKDKRNVTLYFNSKLYEQYTEYCQKEGLLVSRQIEKFIERELLTTKDIAKHSDRGVIKKTL